MFICIIRVYCSVPHSTCQDALLLTSGREFPGEPDAYSKLRYLFTAGMFWAKLFSAGARMNMNIEHPRDKKRYVNCYVGDCPTLCSKKTLHEQSPVILRLNINTIHILTLLGRAYLLLKYTTPLPR